ncbi:thiol reductant ABC exporter subunit CydC [Xanthobacter autotrophicus]|uniref:thiol reductant ABC exporter subunit CydC n=1 Tax=Xanthobacter TaxID=279 RepID=UPI0024ABE378|nr:thiol reductant ABC exporter subunit CydC [Xanthobacter autotrophicus]MDI4663198.1 thiol reductant ABC exporter subunit CydC [Xanthobacter autotrophicus]
MSEAIARDDKRLSAFLGKLRAPARRELSLAYGFAFVAGLCVIAQAALAARLVDLVIFAHRPLTEAGIEIAAFLAAVALRAVGWAAPSEMQVQKGRCTLMARLRSNLLDHVARLGPAGLTALRTEETVAALSAGIRAVEPYYTRYLPASLMAVLLPLAILAAVFPLDWVSGLAGWMVLAVLLAAAASLSHVGLMAASGWFITAMALAGAAGAAMNPFTASAAIRAFALARTAARHGERLVGHDATLRFLARLRPWFFARLVPLAPAALEAERSGDLLARLRTDIDRLEFAFLRILSPVLAALVVVAVAAAFVAAHDGAIALLLLGLALVAGAGVPALAHGLGAGASRRLAAGTGAYEAALVDHLEGAAELAIYDPSGRHRLLLEAQGDALLADEQRLASLAGAASSGVGLVAQVAFLGVLLMGAPAVLGGALGASDWAMLALAALAVFDALAPLPLAMQALPATLASARRIFALVDRAPPVDEAGASSAPAEGALVFAGVGLTYPGAAGPALVDIDLTLAPGRHVAVVGSSGSGKSSLVALALRFRAPDRGVITYGGVPVERIEADALRRRLAVLQQHDHLFADTLIDNLRVADPHAPAGRCAAACATAGILGFVEAQPLKFDTFVGAHGASLSGGEARRLAFARTLMKDAPILMLDEPLEGLDAKPAHEVMSAVLDAARGRALLLLTHSPIGLSRMDEIVVLEEGRIRRRGPPEEVRPPLDNPDLI